MNRKWMFSIFLAALLCLTITACALAAEPITVTSTTDHGDGTVTIRWDNPNGGAVTIGSLVNGSEQARNRINIETDVWGDSYTYTNLAPGLEYILLVMPELELENAGMDIVTVGDVPEFDDFRLQIKDCYLMYAVFKENGDYSYNYAKDLTTQKMLDLLYERSFLVRLDFRHTTFSNSKKYPILTVVTSPTGYVVTDYRDITIPANCLGFWQTTAHMNDALLTMYEDHGYIPTGRYDVKVYVGGEYVGETSFKIQ